MKLVRPEKLNLLTHKELNETWVQQVIADDPTILGLGDLILKDKERIHPKAGRAGYAFSRCGQVKVKDIRLKFSYRQIDKNHYDYQMVLGHRSETYPKYCDLY